MSASSLMAVMPGVEVLPEREPAACLCGRSVGTLWTSRMVPFCGNLRYVYGRAYVVPLVRSYRWLSRSAFADSGLVSHVSRSDPSAQSAGF